MGLICFDDLRRSFVRSRLLSPIDHFHAGKFGSVGNRSPKSPLKTHAFLYDKVNQSRGGVRCPAGSTLRTPAARRAQTLQGLSILAVNGLRGHMAEFGIIAAQGIRKVNELVAAIEDGSSDLPQIARAALNVVVAQIENLNASIHELDRRIVAWCRANAAARRLATIPGVGPITASALAATITDPTLFQSGRHLAAWLGLVPRQHSTGGKAKLGRITKMGNQYLRKLLIVGMTAVIRSARRTKAPAFAWVNALLERRPARLVSVALANKVARIAWAILIRGETYQAPTMKTAA
jgi:transposase